MASEINKDQSHSGINYSQPLDLATKAFKEAETSGLILKPTIKDPSSTPSQNLKKAVEESKENSQRDSKNTQDRNIEKKTYTLAEKSEVLSTDLVSLYEAKDTSRLISAHLPHQPKPDAFSGMRATVIKQLESNLPQELSKHGTMNGTTKELLISSMKELKNSSLVPKSATFQLMEHSLKPVALLFKPPTSNLTKILSQQTDRKTASQQPNQKTEQRFQQRRQVQEKMAEHFALQQKSEETAQAKQMTTAQTKGEKTTPQAQMRGALAFLKDPEEKTRLFELRQGEEWQLTEKSTSSNPDQVPQRSLSSQAKAKLKQVILLHQDRHSQPQDIEHPRLLPHPSEISDPKLAEEVAKIHAYLAGDIASGAELDVDTRFLLKLYGALVEAKATAKLLGKGENPEFPLKENLAACLAGLLQCGNFAKSGSKNMDAILSLIFRGIFQEGGKTFLLGDLRYHEDGRTRAREIKMIQVALGDGVNEEQMLAWLAALKPGEAIPAHQLRGLFGEELNYTEMAHGELKPQISEAAESQSLLQDAASREKFALALAAMRRGDHREASFQSEGRETPQIMQRVIPGFWAQLNERFSFNKLLKDLPRLYTALAYIGLGTAGLGIFIFLILKLINS